MCHLQGHEILQWKSVKPEIHGHSTHPALSEPIPSQLDWARNETLGEKDTYGLAVQWWLEGEASPSESLSRKKECAACSSSWVVQDLQLQLQLLHRQWNQFLGRRYLLPPPVKPLPPLLLSPMRLQTSYIPHKRQQPSHSFLIPPISLASGRSVPSLSAGLWETVHSYRQHQNLGARPFVVPDLFVDWQCCASWVDCHQDHDSSCWHWAHWMRRLRELKSNRKQRLQHH